MRGAACTGDDDFDPAFLRVGSVFEKQVGSAMCGDDACFMWNTELAKCFGGEFHGIPVGAGAHDDADERISFNAFAFFHVVGSLSSGYFFFQIVSAAAKHRKPPKITNGAKTGAPQTLR